MACHDTSQRQLTSSRVDLTLAVPTSVVSSTHCDGQLGWAIYMGCVAWPLAADGPQMFPIWQQTVQSNTKTDWWESWFRYCPFTYTVVIVSEVWGVQYYCWQYLTECEMIFNACRSEYGFISHTALPCWFPRSNVQTIVNYICTVWGVF